MKTLTLIYGVALVLLLGCQTLPKAQPTGLTWPKVVEAQRLRAKKFTAVSGKMQLAFHGRRGKGSGRAKLYADLPEAMRLELRDPFGRLHLELLERGGAAIAHYPREQRADRDSRGGELLLEKFLGLSMPFPQFAAVWLGVLPEEWLRASPVWAWDENLAAYVATGKNGTASWEIVVDGTSLEVKGLKWQSVDQEMRVEFSDWEATALGTAAMVVQAQLPRSRSSIEIEWDSLQPLAQSSKGSVFALSLPPGTTQVTLKQ